MVRGAKADVLFAHQRIGQFGDRQKTAGGAAAHSFAIHFGVAHQSGEQPQRARGIRAHGKHQWLQVILAIHDIAERRIVRAGEHGLRLAERFTRQDARMLQRDGISFLRHDAAGLHVGVAQAQVAVFLGAPQKQILDQFSQIHHQHGDCGGFRNVINRSDRAVGIGLQTFEAQKLRGAVAVDWEIPWW